MSERSTQLSRSLGLGSVTLFGLAYMAPMIVLGIFGVIAETSGGSSASAYLVATVAMLFTAQSYGRMARAYPDYSFVRRGLYTEVTRRAVLVAWRFTGTFAKTGAVVEFHGDDRLELGEDGLIHAYRCLYDNKFVLSQLGAGGE